MSIQKARTEARKLLRKSLAGSVSARKRHVARAENIAEEIFRRFQVLPHAWQQKHLLSYMNKMTCGNATKYNHYLTIRKLCAAQGKLDPFKNHIAHWMKKNTDKKMGRAMVLPRNLFES